MNALTGLPVKSSLVTAVLLLLVCIVLSLSGMVEWMEYPPAVRIMADQDGRPIPCEILPNQWNRKVYDRPHYSELLFASVQAGTVSVVNYLSPISFDFPGRNPDRVSLQVDYNTNPIWSYRTEPETVPLTGLSFSHPPRPAYSVGPRDWNVRFYILTAAWGENEAEYAFALQLLGEPAAIAETTDGSSILRFNSGEVDSLEFSPANHLTMVVEDRELIAQVVARVQAAALRRLTTAEAEAAKADEPGEITLDGFTYPRVLHLDFQRRTGAGGQVGSESLSSILLRGEYLVADMVWYKLAEPLTDALLGILAGIHRSADGAEVTRPALTMEAVRALAAGEITPREIVNTYVGESITSGIHSFYTALPDGYAFMIGYTRIEEPMYIRLIDTRTEKAIDPTSESIDAFLNRRVD